MAEADGQRVVHVHGQAVAGDAQWNYWGGLGQQWRFASPVAGYQTISNRYSNLTLDVLNLSTAENAQIIQWNLTNANNQQWSLSRP